MKITAGGVGKGSREWFARDDMGVTVNVVCKDCNEGWMNRLEVAVQPMLTEPIRTGAKIELTIDQQAALAAWACKTAMVFEFAGFTTEPFYTSAERLKLAESATTPRKMVVNLAAYVGNVFCTAHHHFVGYDLMTDPVTKMVGHCTTISLGYFVVQVFGLRIADEMASVFQIPVRDNRITRGDYVVGIWPNPNAVAIWPPLNLLNDTGLTELMNLFNVGPQLPGPPFDRSSFTR